MTVIWFFTYLNIRGAKVIGDSSKIFGVIVLAPFVIMTVLGLFQMHYNPLHPFIAARAERSAQSLNLGLFVVMWNYLGWDGLSTIAGEMKNPQRDYPKTLIITLPLITACYLLPTLIGLAVVGRRSRRRRGRPARGTTIAKIIGGGWLGALMAFGALVSAAGLFSALLLSVTRDPVRDGRGRLPAEGAVQDPQEVRHAVGRARRLERDLLGLHPGTVPEPRRRRRDRSTRGRCCWSSSPWSRSGSRSPTWSVRTRSRADGRSSSSSCWARPAIIALAVWDQIMCAGFFTTVGLSLLFLASGPILYPIARYFKKRRGETDVFAPAGIDGGGGIAVSDERTTPAATTTNRSRSPRSTRRSSGSSCPVDGSEGSEVGLAWAERDRDGHRRRDPRRWWRATRRSRSGVAASWRSSTSAWRWRKTRRRSRPRPRSC